jgi:hypothetical protein
MLSQRNRFPLLIQVMQLFLLNMGMEMAMAEMAITATMGKLVVVERN